MMISSFFRRESIAAALAWTVLLAPLATGISHAADRTLAEFKVYAAEKAPTFSEAQLDALAKGVDKNNDQIISDAEFAGRMEVFRAIASRPPVKADRASANVSKQEASAGPSHGQPDITSPRTRSSHATILLITGDKIAASWMPFAEWKTRNGKATKIVTVSQIEHEYTAAIVQEKIRLCVRDHIENHGTRWVVLGGDSLPGGKGLVPGGHLTVHSAEPAGIPTDIVYLSETNWDADGDGIYGEWEEDREAISYPDGTVGLGRIPVRTTADVMAFTDKVIAYESRYPTTDFATQMIYTCTDSPAYPKVRNSWDGYVSKVWHEGRSGRFFSQETPWDKDGKAGSHQLSAENLIALINGKTAGKMHIHGHGHLPAWVLEGSKFTAEHAKRLDNDGAYPLITTVSCNTGEYDSHTDPSIVELMIRQPNRGSVAIVAPIRTGKPHFHSSSDFRLMVTEGKLDGTTQTMTRYWCNGLGSGLTTGEAIMKAKAEMIPDALKSASYHLCICELNLLGDPTLDMRSTTPRTPKLEVPANVLIGEQVVQIVTDAPGSTICLWKGQEVYTVVQADENGNAKLKIETASAGDLRITVSGANLNTRTATTQVASPQ